MRQEVVSLLQKKSRTYEEVVVHDSYRLRTLNFTPQLAIDIGAHVGCFAAAVNNKWPNCRIVAVEPDQGSVASLNELSKIIPNLTVLNAALGKGRVRCMPWRHPEQSDSNVYWSDGCQDICQEQSDWVAESQETLVPCLTLREIANFAVLPKDYIVKIDCEGAECTLYNDPEAFEILQQARYIAVEIHIKGMRWDTITCDDSLDVVRKDSGRVLEGAEKWTESFKKTHNIDIVKGTRLWMFVAYRKA